MLTQKSVMFNFPFGGPVGKGSPRGKDVRHFDPVGPFWVKSFADDEWFVSDDRLVNEHGLPLPPKSFDSRAAVEEFLRTNL